MNITRPSFDDVLDDYKAYLLKNSMSTEIVWLRKKWLSGYKAKIWVFSPSNDGRKKTAEFYEAIRKTSSSIRVDALCRYAGKSLCFVECFGGDRALLNFGIFENKDNVIVVNNRLYWVFIKLWNQIRGGSPLLESLEIPR